MLMSSIIVMGIIMAGSLAAQENINREILPVVAPEPQTYTELDVRNTKPPKPFDVGLDNQTPVAVTENIGYGPEETQFTGKIDKVVITIN